MLEVRFSLDKLVHHHTPSQTSIQQPSTPTPIPTALRCSHRRQTCLGKLARCALRAGGPLPQCPRRSIRCGLQHRADLQRGLDSRDHNGIKRLNCAIDTPRGPTVRVKRRKDPGEAGRRRSLLLLVPCCPPRSRRTDHVDCTIPLPSCPTCVPRQLAHPQGWGPRHDVAARRARHCGAAAAMVSLGECQVCASSRYKNAAQRCRASPRAALLTRPRRSLNLSRALSEAASPGRPMCSIYLTLPSTPTPTTQPARV